MPSIVLVSSGYSEAAGKEWMDGDRAITMDHFRVEGIKRGGRRVCHRNETKNWREGGVLRSRGRRLILRSSFVLLQIDIFIVVQNIVLLFHGYL